MAPFWKKKDRKVAVVADDDMFNVARTALPAEIGKLMKGYVNENTFLKHRKGYYSSFLTLSIVLLLIISMISPTVLSQQSYDPELIGTWVGEEIIESIGTATITLELKSNQTGSMLIILAGGGTATTFNWHTYNNTLVFTNRYSGYAIQEDKVYTYNISGNMLYFESDSLSLILTKQPGQNVYLIGIVILNVAIIAIIATALYKRRRSSSSGKDDRIIAMIEKARRSNATKLDLSNKGLTSLPPEIRTLTNLTCLSVFGNQLTALPPEIRTLTNLTCLHVSSNQLTALPPELGKLTNLTTLRVPSNQLTALPPEIGKLTNLTKLGLSSNQLTSLPPELGKLTNLTELNLEGNKLIELPPELGKLTKLEKIFLNGAVAATIPGLKKHKDGYYPGQEVVAHFKNEFRKSLMAWLSSFEAIAEGEELEDSLHDVVERVHGICESLKADRTLDTVFETIQADISELERILKFYEEFSIDGELETDMKRLQANIEAKRAELQQSDSFRELLNRSLREIEDQTAMWILDNKSGRPTMAAEDLIAFASDVVEEYRNQVKQMAPEPVSLKARYANERASPITDEAEKWFAELGDIPTESHIPADILAEFKNLHDEYREFKAERSIEKRLSAVKEEIERLKIHISSYRRIAERDTEAGKRATATVKEMEQLIKNTVEEQREIEIVMKERNDAIVQLEAKARLHVLKTLAGGGVLFNVEDAIRTAENVRAALIQKLSKIEIPKGEFSGYIILGLIGTGGQGDVYKVRKGDEIYAMKMAKGADWRGSKSYNLTKEVVGIFNREGDVWSKASEAQGVVKLHSYKPMPFPWFVMEHMDGGSLADRMSSINLSDSIDSAIRILETLEEIHKLGIIHRDLKPENVMYNSAGEVKLTDFGLSKVLGSGQSSMLFKGTLEYSAPEQFRDSGFGDTDERTDVYQVGALIYRLITGRPHQSSGKQPYVYSSGNEPIPPSTVKTGLPKGIDEAIIKALAKDKKDRWQSVGEFRNALVKLKEGVPHA